MKNCASEYVSTQYCFKNLHAEQRYFISLSRSESPIRFVER